MGGVGASLAPAPREGLAPIPSAGARSPRRLSGPLSPHRGRTHTHTPPIPAGPAPLGAGGPRAPDPRRAGAAPLPAAPAPRGAAGPCPEPPALTRRSPATGHSHQLGPDSRPALLPLASSAGRRDPQRRPANGRRGRAAQRGWLSGQRWNLLAGRAVPT